MKNILNHLYEHNTLTKAEAKRVLTEIAEGKHNNSQVASFMTVFNMRSITVEELDGFREAMLELCIPVDLKEYDPIDLCGTGGDGKNTFNISTLSTFLVAAAGVKVAKHGNKSVSSACGSSNVLEYFGYQFTNDEDTLRKDIEDAGVCFLHAPLFHPAMKNVGPVRGELGVKTFFNMLGPMVNPAFVNKQLVGVFSLELARLYHYIYKKSGRQYVILHGLEGYDEISLTGPFKYYTPTEENIIGPEELGKKQLKAEDLFGGNTVEEAAKIFEDVLTGSGTEAQNNAVIANAGMGIYCAKEGIGLLDAQAEAKDALDSGKALEVFKKVIKK